MIREGVLAIIKNGRNYLLIHNKGTGNITFPAGAIEAGESDREALVRELLEETGLKPGDYEITDSGLTYEFTYNKRKESRYGQRVRQKVYLLKTSKTELEPEDSGLSIHGWFTKEEVLRELTFPELRELFTQLILSKGI